MREAFPDAHYDYDADAMIADETGVAVAWTATGTHKGELRGIEPTGEDISVRGAMLVYFDDEIEQVVWDELGMLQQLGGNPDRLVR